MESGILLSDRTALGVENIIGDDDRYPKTTRTFPPPWTLSAVHDGQPTRNHGGGRDKKATIKSNQQGKKNQRKER